MIKLLQTSDRPQSRPLGAPGITSNLSFGGSEFQAQAPFAQQNSFRPKPFQPAFQTNPIRASSEIPLNSDRIGRSVDIKESYSRFNQPAQQAAQNYDSSHNPLASAGASRQIAPFAFSSRNVRNPSEDKSTNHTDKKLGLKSRSPDRRRRRDSNEGKVRDISRNLRPEKIDRERSRENSKRDYRGTKYSNDRYDSSDKKRRRSRDSSSKRKKTKKSRSRERGSKQDKKKRDY